MAAVTKEAPMVRPAIKSPTLQISS